MEEKREQIHIETFQEKVKKGFKHFVDSFVNYCKTNFLACIIVLVALLFLILQLIPAAIVTVKDLSINMSIDGVTTIKNLNGEQSFSYNVFEVLFGRNEWLNVIVSGASGSGTPIYSTESLFTYFVPFNVTLGVGMILLYSCAILILIDKRIPRIIGAGLGVVGFILVSVFMFIQPSYSLPIIASGATCDYSVTWLAGGFIAMVLAFAIAGLSCYVCVTDNIKREKYRKSESDRYMRGGI